MNACSATTCETTTTVSSPSLTCQYKYSPSRRWWVQSDCLSRRWEVKDRMFLTTPVHLFSHHPQSSHNFTFIDVCFLTVIMFILVIILVWIYTKFINIQKNNFLVIQKLFLILIIIFICRINVPTLSCQYNIYEYWLHICYSDSNINPVSITLWFFFLGKEIVIFCCS